MANSLCSCNSCKRKIGEYKQIITDYAEFEWVRTYFVYDTNAYMAKAFAIDDYGNSYVAGIN